jgi:hypothetical protein
VKWNFDLAIKIVLVVSCKWNVATEHFKDHDSKGPDIYFLAVLLLANDFWSNVRFSAKVTQSGVGKI